MNADRHRLKVDLAEQIQRANDYEKMKDKGLLDIQRLREDM